VNLFAGKALGPIAQKVGLVSKGVSKRVLKGLILKKLVDLKVPEPIRRKVATKRTRDQSVATNQSLAVANTSANQPPANTNRTPTNANANRVKLNEPELNFRPNGTAEFLNRETVGNKTFVVPEGASKMTFPKMARVNSARNFEAQNLGKHRALSFSGATGRMGSVNRNGNFRIPNIKFPTFGSPKKNLKIPTNSENKNFEKMLKQFNVPEPPQLMEARRELEQTRAAAGPQNPMTQELEVKVREMEKKQSPQATGAGVGNGNRTTPQVPRGNGNRPVSQVSGNGNALQKVKNEANAERRRIEANAARARANLEANARRVQNNLKEQLSGAKNANKALEIQARLEKNKINLETKKAELEARTERNKAALAARVAERQANVNLRKAEMAARAASASGRSGPSLWNKVRNLVKKKPGTAAPVTRERVVEVLMEAGAPRAQINEVRTSGNWRGVINRLAQINVPQQNDGAQVSPEQGEGFKGRVTNVGTILIPKGTQDPISLENITNGKVYRLKNGNNGLYSYYGNGLMTWLKEHNTHPKTRNKVTNVERGTAKVVNLEKFGKLPDDPKLLERLLVLGQYISSNDKGTYLKKGSGGQKFYIEPRVFVNAMKNNAHYNSMLKTLNTPVSLQRAKNFLTRIGLRQGAPAPVSGNGGAYVPAPVNSEAPIQKVEESNRFSAIKQKLKNSGVSNANIQKLIRGSVSENEDTMLSTFNTKANEFIRTQKQLKASKGAQNTLNILKAIRSAKTIEELNKLADLAKTHNLKPEFNKMSRFLSPNFTNVILSSALNSTNFNNFKRRVVDKTFRGTPVPGTYNLFKNKLRSSEHKLTSNQKKWLLENNYEHFKNSLLTELNKHIVELAKREPSFSEFKKGVNPMQNYQLFLATLPESKLTSIQKDLLAKNTNLGYSNFRKTLGVSNKIHVSVQNSRVPKQALQQSAQERLNKRLNTIRAIKAGNRNNNLKRLKANNNISIKQAAENRNTFIGSESARITEGIFSRVKKTQTASEERERIEKILKSNSSTKFKNIFGFNKPNSKRKVQALTHPNKNPLNKEVYNTRFKYIDRFYETEPNHVSGPLLLKNRTILNNIAAATSINKLNEFKVPSDGTKENKIAFRNAMTARREELYKQNIQKANIVTLNELEKKIGRLFPDLLKNINARRLQLNTTGGVVKLRKNIAHGNALVEAAEKARPPVPRGGVNLYHGEVNNTPPPPPPRPGPKQLEYNKTHKVNAYINSLHETKTVQNAVKVYNSIGKSIGGLDALLAHVNELMKNEGDFEKLSAAEKAYLNAKRVVPRIISSKLENIRLGFWKELVNKELNKPTRKKVLKTDLAREHLMNYYKGGYILPTRNKMETRLESFLFPNEFVKPQVNTGRRGQGTETRHGERRTGLAPMGAAAHPRKKVS
jgi:hypothetical protein